MKISRIGDVRYVERYLDYNVPVEIDIPSSARRMNARKDGFIDEYLAGGPELLLFDRVSTGSLSERIA